jgi:adenylate cyclase
LDFSGANLRKSFVAEVDKLVQATQIMERELATFVRYVPRTLVQALIDSHVEPKLGGSRRNVTIMFTDVANFSTMSENLAPVDLMRKISSYYEVLARQIGSHHGLIQKFLGDGLMGLWNAPSLDHDHVQNACKAALDCKVATNRLNADWERWGWYPMHTRIGLHVGEVAVGNVGTADRMDYTAVGVAVNVASRLEGLNKIYGTQILCSESVKQAAEDGFLFRSLDWVVPAGLGQPVGIYELVGIRPGAEPAADRELVATEAQMAMCEAWEAAYAQYLRRDWQAASVHFAALAAQQPMDALVRLYLRRVQDYLRDPPPPDWNGVSVYTEK